MILIPRSEVQDLAETDRPWLGGEYDRLIQLTGGGWGVLHRETVEEHGDDARKMGAVPFHKVESASTILSEIRDDIERSRRNLLELKDKAKNIYYRYIEPNYCAPDDYNIDWHTALRQAKYSERWELSWLEKLAHGWKSISSHQVFLNDIRRMALIAFWTAELAYKEAQRERIATAPPVSALKETPHQQPHGHDHDEGTI